MNERPSDNGATDGPALRPGARLMLLVYKLTLSPLLAAFGARCRYAPTCSAYAAEAVSRHGLWAGAWMALARVQRCHPFSDSGFDPVPSRNPHARWYTPWRFGIWRMRGED